MEKTMPWKMSARSIGKIAWALVRFLLLFGLGYTLLSPFLTMISLAFRAEEDLWDPSVVWITRHYTAEHLTEVIKMMDYWKSLGTTALVAIGSALLQMFSCAVVGYGFARYHFKGKAPLFAIVIFTIIVPPQVTMMPTYALYRNLGLLNTVWAFWLPSLLGMGLRSGLLIFLYRQVFRALPSDLEEAATIDGCGSIATYFKIMLPNAATSMVTVALFSFIWHSTDGFTTSLLMPSNKMITGALQALSSQLAYLGGGTSQNTVSPLILQSRTQAGSLLVVFPLVLVFAFFQRYFREGIERTGLVG